MSLIDHIDKIVFIKEYLMASGREYLLVYGLAGSGKFHIVNQAYNIIDETIKTDLYLTLIRGDIPLHYGEKTAPNKKYVIIRETLDTVANTYINGWNAETIQFLADPVHVHHTLRNYDLEFRRWLKILKTDATDVDSPVLDLIPLRDEYLLVDYAGSETPGTVIYNYGLKGQSVTVIFGETSIQFAGFTKCYLRLPRTPA